MTIPSSDYDLDSGLSGLAFRQELNPILESILTLSASASLPPTTFPFMLRADQSGTPNVLQIRNPSDNAFLKWAEITDSAINLFSGGAAVPSLGSAQTFTANQTVDTSGSAGQLSIGSNQSSGVVARVPMFGHNSLGSNVTGVNLVCRIGTNTSGSEDFSFEIEVVRGGSTETVMNLGSLSDFRRSGNDGTLDADVIRQDGTELDQLLREATGRIGPTPRSFSASFEPVQADEGSMFRFNGNTNVTVSLSTKTTNTVMYFQNESGSSSANITFAAAASNGVTDFRTARLTLPGGAGITPTCAVHWYLSGGTRVNIYGNNTA